jgi:hypothetical protein
MLAAKGMDSVTAGRAAMGLLGRALTGQSTVIAFDTAFAAVALLFVVAAPVLVTIKIAFARYEKMHAAWSPCHPKVLDFVAGDGSSPGTGGKLAAAGRIGARTRAGEGGTFARK